MPTTDVRVHRQTAALAEQSWLLLATLAALKATLPDFLEALIRGGFNPTSLELLVSSGRSQYTQLVSLLLDVSIICVAIFRFFQHFYLAQSAPALRVFGNRTLLFFVTITTTLVMVSFLTSNQGSRGILVLLAASAGLTFGVPHVRRIVSISQKIGMSIIVSSLVAGVFLTGLAWAPDYSSDRFALSTGWRLNGVMVHPNMLGLVCAWFVAATLAKQKKTTSDLIGVATGIITLVASGSRTAGIGLALVLGYFMVRQKWKARFALTTVLALFLYSLLPLFLPELISFVDGRSIIWSSAVMAWGVSPIFGRGLEYWQGRQILDGFPDFAFHAHNQILDILVTTGILGATAVTVLFVTSLLSLWRQKAHSISNYAWASVILIFSQFPLEVPLQFTLLDIRSIILVFFLIVATTREDQSD